MNAFRDASHKFDEHVDAPDEHVDEPGNGKNSSSPAGKRQLKLVPFDQLTIDGSAVVYLVKGLIPRVGLIVIWGPPKCGKSFVAFDMMLHVALDWSYRGRRVHAGPVVYCAFEGAEGFKARAEAFRRRYLSEGGEAVPFFLLGTPLDLVKQQGDLLTLIRSTLGKEHPTAVVLDTLNRSLRGSENSDEDMTAYVRAADAIRDDFGCAVVVVHHCGVDATRPRGHTSLTGAVDAQLAVKRDGANNVVMTVEWMKDGPEGDTIVSQLEPVEVGTDADGDPITSCVVVPSDSETPASGPARATGAAKLALDLLHRLIIDAGEIPPASNHVPVGMRCVPVNLWRSYCYEGTVTDSDDPDSKRKAFNRAAKKLQEIKAIGVWNDLVWIPGISIGTSGT